MMSAVLVIFGDTFPARSRRWWHRFQVVIGPKRLRDKVPEGLAFLDIEDFTEAGSIYEASSLAEELSRLKLADGSRLAKSFVYRGYELWWIYYSSLFLFFCLPYTQYRRLLQHLKGFDHIYFYEPPYKALFSCYLRAHGLGISIIGRRSGLKILSFVPLGIFLQIILTILFIPALILRKRKIMLFTGDKFDKSKDYDFRMKFIYKALRDRDLSFVEFIRSLESWKTVLAHALVRKRPVIYPEAIRFLGQFVSILTGGRIQAKRRFGPRFFSSARDPEEKFKVLLATQYLLGVYDDIWAIRITGLILRAIGVKAALIPAATDRNFHAVLGCKVNGIPIIGILHGVASRFYNVYDFLPAYDGAKSLSVDKYGLWSDWWKEYYSKYSKAYRTEQLHVSGLMRPLEGKKNDSALASYHQRSGRNVIKALFVAGELSNPEEVLPYLQELFKVPGISAYLTFRPYRDRFEDWLKKNNPHIIERMGEDRILRGNIHDAISACDIVVGSYSTGALEALLQLKPVVFFNTRKWGDYFDLRGYSSHYKFFAENPGELVEYVKRSDKIPPAILAELRERFFGDPYRNGSEWMVEEAEKVLKNDS